MSLLPIKEHFKFGKKGASKNDEGNTPPPSLFSKLWFLTALSFGITLVNYILTYSNKSFDLTNLYYFLSDFLISFIVLRFFMFCTSQLDLRVSWKKNLRKRLMLQLALITPLIAVFDILINELVEGLFYTGRVDIGFYTFDMILAVLFIFLVQFLYISLHFLQNRTQLSAATSPKVPPALKTASGKQTVFVPQAECLIIFVHANITYVVNKEYRNLILDLPLKDVENMLDDRFFRANRQFIVSKEAVSGFRSLEFGKLEVSLTSTNKLVPDTLTISRNNASSFRKWVSS